MAKSRKQVDIVDPTPIQQDVRQDFPNCWREWGSPDKVWVGFFVDWETGLGWIKVQDDPKAYTLNNVPPVRAIGGNGNGTPVRPRQSVRDTRPRPNLPVTQPVLDTRVTALREEAKVLLDEHREAEAADLAAGNGS